MARKNNSVVISGKTDNQKEYLRKYREYGTVLLDGCPGTGKSFINIGLACQLLLKNKVDRIIFCRKAAYHADKLGYTSGSFKEKAYQSFGPQIDYFKEFLGCQEFDKLYNEGAIELNAVGLITGFSWKSKIILADEVQEFDKEDILRLQSRMDINSKLVLMGSVEQGPQNSFFERMMNAPNNDKIFRMQFTEEDIMRHPDMYEVYKHWRDIR